MSEMKKILTELGYTLTFEEPALVYVVEKGVFRREFKYLKYIKEWLKEVEDA